MYYIVCDFEFNQAYDFELDQKTKSNPVCPFEIIQIGAVKLSEDFEEVGEFNILIKPTLYPKLNPYVSKLTGITEDSFNDCNAKSFDEGIKMFADFCGKDRPVLCVWGKNDVSTLFKNIEFNETKDVNLPIEYINIQEYASRKLKHYSGTHIGLRRAIEQLNIDLGISYHDALNDAKYTAEIFKIYKNIKIPIAKYSVKTSKPKNYKSTTRIKKTDINPTKTIMWGNYDRQK